MEINHNDLILIRDLLDKAQISADNALVNIFIAKKELHNVLKEVQDLFSQKEQEVG